MSWASWGQLKVWVPEKTVQLSPALAKFMVGWPPWPLKAVRKARGMMLMLVFAQ